VEKVTYGEFDPGSG